MFDPAPIPVSSVMQTIVNEQSPQERADHEAGHYVAAYTLQIPHRIAFITIVDSPPAEDGEVQGGCCALGWKGEPAPEHFAVYSIAGMTAQMMGIRNRGGEDEAVALQRVQHGGAGDIDNFRKRFGDNVDVNSYTLPALRLLTANWGLVVVLGNALKEHRTLYSDEARLILDAATFGSKSFLDSLEAYRKGRLELPPFEQLQRERPRMKWFETFERFMQREGRSPPQVWDR